jgi:hypothetical protein
MNDQRTKALGIANQKRRQIRNLRLGIEAGTTTFRELVLPRPLKTIESIPMVDVARWVPGFQARAEVRQARLGAAALVADVNLLQTVGEMPREHREWVAEFVARPAMSSAERSQRSRERDRIGSDEVVELRMALDGCRASLRRAERERDIALGKIRDLEAQVAGHQFVMPTVVAERMLIELADAVEEHKRGLSRGAPNFANADQALWAKKDEILMSGAPNLRSAA